MNNNAKKEQKEHYEVEKERYEVESAEWKREWKEKQENCSNIKEEQIITLHRNEQQQNWKRKKQ